MTCSPPIRSCGALLALLPSLAIGDLLLGNARVHTVNEARPTAGAVCIRGNRIAAVGDQREVETACTGSEVLDLGGATVVPGWVDAHFHLTSVGTREMILDLSGIDSLDAFADAVARHVAKLRPGEWVVGRGWIETHWQPPRFPSLRLVDTLAPDNPLYLQRTDGHAAIVNSLALAAAGIDADAESPQGGEILRAEDGRATGMLIDTAQDLVRNSIPPPDEATQERALELANAFSLRHGLTQVHDAGLMMAGRDSDAAEIDRLQRLYADGRMQLRVYKAVVAPHGDADELLQRGALIGAANGRLTVRAIKVQIDGALGSRGAALLEPYSDRPESHGLIRLGDDVLAPLFERALRRGIQIEAHAIGDQANRHLLDLFEQAFARVPARERGVTQPRWRIEHAQIVHPDDQPRFARLGVIPSMQPSHAISDLYFAPARLGTDRLAHGYTWRTFVDMGLPVPGGSDAPVERGDPMIEYYAAVARKDLEGRSFAGWHPEQALSRLDALRMFTIWPAYASFEEQQRGSIEAGKLADLTILSQDILNIPEAQILDTKVLMTIIDGEVVYSRDTTAEHALR